MLARNTIGLASLAVVLALVGGKAQAADILGIGDTIIAIDADVATNSASPGGEQAPLAIDNDTATKYLNFATTRSGFIITPSGSGAVQSFIMTTGNDAPGRDPSSYEFYGTNDIITSEAHLNGREEDWTLISMGDITLPGDPAIGDDQRNVAGDPVGFVNGTDYTSYKMIFPTTKTANTIMQFSEIEFLTSMDGSGTDISMPGDFIIPIQDVDFTPQSNYPAGENPRLIYDNNVNTKYLNGGGVNSGFIVTPLVGQTVVNGFQITTANDAEIRDPAAYEIYGTNDPIESTDNSYGRDEDWTLIQSGTVTLPTERLTAGGVVAINGNSSAYSSYKVVFPELKDNNTIMQIAEFELFTPTQATLTVDRQTGSVILAATENITFDSLEILSVLTNALDASEWNSLTDGSPNSDPNDTWSTSSSTSESLAEMDAAGGADDGFSLTTGSSMNLGNIWRAVPTEYEDIRAVLTNDGGLALGVDIQFVGTEIVEGDYDGNGSVGPEDWPLFRDVLGRNYEGQTAGAAYLGGDLDGDFDSDIDDFNRFIDLYFAAGNSALNFNAVPEPSSVAIALGALVAVVGLRRANWRGIAMLLLAFTFVGAATQVNAQTFTLDNTIVPTVTIPDGQENENVDSGPENFFDDVVLDDPLDNDLFVADYNGEGVVSAQYAGLGAAPKVVFMDYGASINPNWFSYAQRSGADPTADRVGSFEFWFSNSDFGGVLPGGDPDAVLNIDPDDERLRDSILRPYPLGSDSLSGRYVAMRLTVSDLSANQPVNNIGGHEFRFLDGPSDVVLTVNRETGELTLSNNGSNAQAIEMQAYQIESEAEAFIPGSFNGLAGDVTGFTQGNGLSDGWETTGNSPFRLIEANFFAADDLPTGISNVSLGTALATGVPAEDISFTWTNSFGDVFDGRVEYVGDITQQPGDYNGDGTVDIADYTTWRNNLGSTTANLNGDLTPSGVTAADYQVWKDNFGETLPGALAGVASSVPEPTTWISMLAVAGLMLNTLRGGNKKHTID